ncbi:trimeric intracellular cation channel family protein [Siccirubricoccus sp. G192]|uniref:trimeric intracellular cation channel family protein n=1 Tax=Siccirubricoccus sp. G192 TaxID=2849651 RepID=UPI0028112D4D|nr:trimeric intracellular cation channel family protein [Siccirubricoccus sp. G192]
MPSGLAAFEQLLRALDLLGIAAFAASGALVASRKQLDIVGFVLIAIVTGFGGGTLRDLLLGRTPVFWLRAPELLGVCAAAAVLVFFTAHLVESRFRLLLWVDALGLALYAVVGAEIALLAGADPWAAVLLGVVTATTGGILRDVICDELPLILRREIYLTAAAVGATTFVALRIEGVWREPALAAGFLAAFGLRAVALLRGWSLPAYRARPGRDYPDRG